MTLTPSTSWATGGLQVVDEPRTITVGVADDEVLVRTGVRGALEQSGGIAVVGEAGDGNGAVELARRQRPQVLLMDASMPGMEGLSAVRVVRRHVPGTQVIVLCGPQTEDMLFPALRAGAAGFLFKTGDAEALRNAVRAVAAGEAMLSPSATRALIDHFTGADSERRDAARNRISLLTRREQEVLVYLAQGMANARIARLMYLSEGAIKAHVSRLLTKLRCDNRVQAALIARDAALPC
ncbi:DNA-binding response regulator, NarL/FixJ family, contains REC and HTH domains [Lentzea fradiae]|uniref:DNA-binding response regulator, NarL/FixJ family, contains REC and HTH domains n=1 Tax=Lentzea fradiae TaxID=200378 RepID=A0A1G7QCI5_9PSEU|nr:response regulator transcription factor [Lentzea fradiae]SDF95310.1 DNA-binding response regulator, NarL/FixJ family, contains REC and HTH domains [Lentzea fradiae]